eukprot:746356-Hanusia_phi.AAC.1
MVHVNSDLTFSSSDGSHAVAVQPYSLEAYLVNDDSSMLDRTSTSVGDDTRSNQSPAESHASRHTSTEYAVAERPYGQRRPVILPRPLGTWRSWQGLAHRFADTIAQTDRQDSHQEESVKTEIVMSMHADYADSMVGGRNASVFPGGNNTAKHREVSIEPYKK